MFPQIALDKLASSCLTADDAERLGITFLEAHETQALTGVSASALKIAYNGANGIWRVRFLDHKGPFGEPHALRYYQLPDSPPDIYLPNFVDWALIREQPEKSILITEGEFKAACTTKHGIPTISLGGVWSFKSQKLWLSFFPPL